MKSVNRLAAIGDHIHISKYVKQNRMDLQDGIECIRNQTSHPINIILKGKVIKTHRRKLIKLK